MEEVWKPIEGFDYYLISNLGRVKRLEHKARPIFRYNQEVRNTLCEKILKSSESRTIRGYLTVTLRNDKGVKVLSLHRLVAQAFIPNPLKLPQVNHKDGVKYNNHVDNLEWTTAKENQSHARKTGLISQNGENSVNSKLTEEEVLRIRELWKEGGITQKSLAKMFGIGQMNICRIVNRKRWSHI